MDDSLQASLKKWNALKHLKGNQLKDIVYFNGFKVDKNDEGEGKSGALFLTTDDEMFATGYNSAENLLALTGDDLEKSVELTEPRKIVQLSGLGIRKFVVTEEFGVAITSESKLIYWGRKMKSVHLGDKNPNNVHLPHQPRENFRAVDMACGARCIVFLTDKGEVVIWGNVGTFYSNFFEFERIVTRKNVRVRFLSCGWNHVALLDQNGDVWTFGHGSVGQLGYEWSSSDGYTIPRKVTLPGVCVKVECGLYSTLFLMKTQEIYACGSNSQSDHLCVSRTGYVIKPVKVQLNSPITDIAATYAWSGSWQSLFGAYSGADKKYYKWGDDPKLEAPDITNDAHSFFDIFTNFKTPQTVANISWTNSVDLLGDVETGSLHNSQRRRFFDRWAIFDTVTDDFLSKIEQFVVMTAIPTNFSTLAKTYLAYVVTNDDDVYSWSNARTVTLGQPEETLLTFAPAKMESLCQKNIRKIIVNFEEGLALSKDGSVYSWRDYETPVQFERLGRLKDIANEITANIFLTEDNTVWISDAKSVRKIHVPVLDEIVAIECGIHHCALLTLKSGVFTFGEDRYGQLGYKLKRGDSSEEARQVSLPAACKKITCGLSTTYFLLENGELYACGINSANDRIPVERNGQVSVPQKLVLNGPIVDVAATKHFNANLTLGTTVAVQTANGEIYKWGGLFRSPTLVEGITTLVEAFEDTDIPQSMSLVPVAATNEIDIDDETDLEDGRATSRAIREVHSSFLDDPLYSDLQIKLANSTTAAHRLILHTKSSFFRNQLLSTKLANRNHLDLSSYNPNAIIAMLKHIYEIPIGQHADELKDLIDFHEVANMDGDKELITKSERLLGSNLMRIAMTNVAKLLNDETKTEMSVLFPGGPFP